MGIVGPTIMELQCALGIPYEQVVQLITAKALGFSLGSLANGFLYDRVNPLLTLTTGMAAVAVCTILTPWSTSLVTLLIVGFLCNMSAGVIPPTTYVFVLHLWGKKSQPYMQAINFCFSFGALLAPLVASPFLSVPQELATDSIVTNITIGAQALCDPETLKVYIPYAILGVLALTLAALLLYLYLYHGKTDEHPSRLGGAVDIAKGGDDFAMQKGIILALAAIFLVTLHGVEVVMNNFIASFAVMSDLHLTKQLGAYMTSLFWFMITAGRLVAIWTIVKIGALHDITIHLVIIVVANGVLVPFGNSHPWCLWLGTALMGIGVSSVWASTFSLLELQFSVTSAMASFLVLCTCLAESAYPVFMGYAISNEPQLFLWLISACASLCIVSFIMVNYFCRKLRGA
ncbi:Major facilitator superfamily domain-containing protein 4B [Halotydeus destructor]|nr:Major facilitator superfamily domain-containing protein 4B [Halotydeus destructor]